jgi:hypothetical protein
MEIAYNISDVKKFYQEGNSIRKRLVSRTLLVRGKKGNIASKKEKVLQGVWNIMRSTLDCKME